ncbi:MAG: protein kinase [Kofleriaceae bacterium]
MTWPSTRRCRLFASPQDAHAFTPLAQLGAGPDGSAVLAQRGDKLVELHTLSFGAIDPRWVALEARICAIGAIDHPAVRLVLALERDPARVVLEGDSFPPLAESIEQGTPARCRGPWGDRRGDRPRSRGPANDAGARASARRSHASRQQPRHATPRRAAASATSCRRHHRRSVRAGPAARRRRDGRGVGSAGHDGRRERRDQAARPEIARDAELLRRFRKEARVLGTVGSAYIANAIDLNEDRGLHYLVLELVTGGSVGAALKRQGKLPERLALAIVGDACRALAQPHRLGIVHRDLKPDNMMFVRAGLELESSPLGQLVKLGDFGIARTTEGVPEGATRGAGKTCRVRALAAPVETAATVIQ